MKKKQSISEQFKGVTITPTALLFSKDCTQATWKKVGQWISASHASVYWHIGDWLAWALDRLPTTSTDARSQVYRLASQQLGSKASWLTAIRMICERIPPSERIPGLSFTHHRIVATFPSDRRAELLRECQEQHLTVQELKEKVLGDRPQLMPRKYVGPRAVARPKVRRRDFELQKEPEDVLYMVHRVMTCCQAWAALNGELNSRSYERAVRHLLDFRSAWRILTKGEDEMEGVA